MAAVTEDDAVSGLGDWVYRHLLGADARPGGGWLDWLVELRDRAGSGRALARQLGVNESTVRRMLNGQTRAPKASTLEALRRSRVDQGALSEDSVSLNTTDRDSERERTLTNANLRLAPGTMERAAAAWIETGDKEAAGAAFLAGVTVPFYKAYLRPRAGDLIPADEGEDDEGELYYDDDGNPYTETPPEEWYDDLGYEDVFGADDEGYGGEVA
jgi:transcriptional regulator with XRE-family HTH domain